MPVKATLNPSMKVPPKRKGNYYTTFYFVSLQTLNESPSEKEGKSSWDSRRGWNGQALNESPSEKEGK